MSINVKKLQIHLFGLGAMALCLICAYGCGLRPVLQAQKRLQLAVAEAEHLQHLLPTLQVQIDELNAQIATKSRQLQERYCIVTQGGQPLLGIVSKMLADRHIDLINLREEAHTTAGQKTLVLQLSSVYGDMLSFIHDLRKLDTPARISHLRLTPLDEFGERCSATLTVHFHPVVPFPRATQEQSLASSASGAQA